MHKRNLNFRLKIKSYDSHASKKEAEGRKEGRKYVKLFCYYYLMTILPNETIKLDLGTYLCYHQTLF